VLVIASAGAKNGLILPVSKWTVFVSSVGHYGIRSAPAKIRGQCLKAMLVVMIMEPCS
jgi:hypothetical protein